ncbi:hypothetical protein NOGI109294_18275 [Nocardiopsis gilva]|uniref:wHTH domain-containing protein n=1 Tax=Nocardiopsis gilva TaxID=280236 RepID=UPI00034549D8|nr:hypothetical protein [Nocardiopsis gilva]
MDQGNTRNFIDGDVNANWLITGRDITVNHCPQETKGDKAEGDLWAECTADSPVWQHVKEGRHMDSFRNAAVEVSARLSKLRQDAEDRLSGDPWLDPGSAIRFLERIGVLIGDPEQGPDLDLYPAEASLLVLTPLLFRVQGLRQAVKLAEVNPASLAQVASPGSERASFEAFCEKHGVLTNRARRLSLDEGAIGWWLFHRWLLEPENVAGKESIHDLLVDVQIPERPFGRTLDPERLNQVFHGLRRGPKVCNREYLELLRADEPVARAQGRQRIREQRMTLVLTLAFSMSLEMASLPMVVVEHLGVPYSVDLAQLRQTLDEAQWGGPDELPVLKAKCDHEAVIVGLREHVTRVDELLHDLQRAVGSRVNPPVPQLPIRVSADKVCPAEGAFDAWARFRIDERRARELLTGVQLYKDRELAIRELYQNALDACRYRRARTDYLNRTSSVSRHYEGRIEFTQGVDENGRRYVECTDNGVGMGEAELRGVFSHAGDRFAEQPDFLMEQEKWESMNPPIKLYPNSRFGIGVLSYFMLADEIRVTTCRMGSDGNLGPILEASIYGPGNLFRIIQITERGDSPGTHVRLYLNGDEEYSTWSCVGVLERVLGIAEFHTLARDAYQVHEWPAGEFRPTEWLSDKQGIRAETPLVEWSQAPHGINVIWCNSGGALLVDGLFVEPDIRRGVFSRKGEGLTCVIVNLTGPHLPKQLSADRAQVLSDISEQVRSLLEKAAMDLVASGNQILSFVWICRLASGSPLLADIITEYSIKHEVKIPLKKGELRTSKTGIFPADQGIAKIGAPQNYGKFDTGNTDVWKNVDGSAPDHIVLWRILTSGEEEMRRDLFSLCPQLSDVGPLRPALPSDQIILKRSISSERSRWSSPKVHKIYEVAEIMDAKPSEVILRMDELEILECHPKLLMAFSDRKDVGRRACEKIIEAKINSLDPNALAWLAKTLDIEIIEIGRILRESGFDISDFLIRRASNPIVGALLEAYTCESITFFPNGDGDISPGAIARVALNLEMSISDTCEQLLECGIQADMRSLPAVADESLIRTLSESGDGHWPWFSYARPLSPADIILIAQRLNITASDAAMRMSDLGFAVPKRFPKKTKESDLDILFDEEGRPLNPTDDLLYMELFEAARNAERPLGEILCRLREFGFDIHLHLPNKTSPLEESLADPFGPLDLWTSLVNQPVPFARVLVASQISGESQLSIINAMSRLGLATSRDKLPHDLRFTDAIKIIPIDHIDEDSACIRSSVTFHELITTAQKMREPVTRVADWLNKLGIYVPDIEECVRNAIPRIPRARGSKSYPIE